MDFTIDCNLPVTANQTALEFSRGLTFFRALESMDSGDFHARVTVEGEERLVKGDLKYGRVASIELLELEPHDTFEGTPVTLRPRKFAKMLTNSGIKASIDEDGVDIESHPVSMYVEDNEIASICWVLSD